MVKGAFDVERCVLRCTGDGPFVRLSREDVRMPALFLNAYSVTFEGGISLWRCARSEDEDKRELERKLGMSVWVDRDAVWSSRRPERRDATLQSFDPSPSPGRTLFAAREGLFLTPGTRDRTPGSVARER